jgi:hypothetical protein
MPVTSGDDLADPAPNRDEPDIGDAHIQALPRYAPRACRVAATRAGLASRPVPVSAAAAAWLIAAAPGGGGSLRAAKDADNKLGTGGEKYYASRLFAPYAAKNSGLPGATPGIVPPRAVKRRTAGAKCYHDAAALTVTLDTAAGVTPALAVPPAGRRCQSVPDTWRAFAP